jgi:hypothetical protein
MITMMAMPTITGKDEGRRRGRPTSVQEGSAAALKVGQHHLRCFQEGLKEGGKGRKAKMKARKEALKGRKEELKGMKENLNGEQLVCRFAPAPPHLSFFFILILQDEQERRKRGRQEKKRVGKKGNTE